MHKSISVTAIILVSVLCLCGLARSQGGGLPPIRQVNAPSDTSVYALERGLLPQASNPGEFEEVDTDLGAKDEDGNPRYVESDVDLENIENDEDPPVRVNGPSGTSAHREELNAFRGHGLPDEDDEGPEFQIPKGYHIHTTDWSTDAPQWSFKAMEWALVSLPDLKNHPNIPSPDIPSPALVVISKQPIQKVRTTYNSKGLENMTLHYYYFLSEGVLPNAIPELEVHQVADGKSQVVSQPKIRGIWSHATVQLPFSGDSKIVFEGRQNMLGNEIAIDDITISGISPGPAEEAKLSNIESEAKDPEVTEDGKGQEGTVTPDEVVEGGQEGTGNGTEVTTTSTAEEGTEKTQETAKEGDDDNQEPEIDSENAEVNGTSTENPQETGETTVNPNIAEQGNGTNTEVEGTGVPEQVIESNSTGIPEFANNTEQVNETDILENSSSSYDKENDTIIATEAPKSTLPESEVTSSGAMSNFTDFSNESVSVENGLDGNSTTSLETPLVNATTLPEVTTDMENNSFGNDSALLESSTLSPGSIDSNITNNTTNNQVISVNTESSVMTNETVPMATDSNLNITDSPDLNVTAEGSNNTSIVSSTSPPTSDNPNPEVIATTDQESSNISVSTDTPLIMTNSTSSGSNNTILPGSSAGIESTVTPDGGSGTNEVSSWSVFRIFLVLSLIGVAVIGFLYWRRQRRRDDEIPVFSRTTHSDYHNPTFTDDDSSFASRGMGNNYKSFE